MEEKRLIRVAIKAPGVVQSVNFRITAKLIADRLELSGAVRNNPDGTVTIEVEGPEERVRQFISKIEELRPSNPFRDHPANQEEPKMKVYEPLIHVRHLEIIEELQLKESLPKGFHIDYGSQFDPFQREVLNKLSLGGVIYDRFHQDHDWNLNVLNVKYHTLREEMHGIKVDQDENLSDLREELMNGIHEMTGEVRALNNTLKPIAKLIKKHLNED